MTTLNYYRGQFFIVTSAEKLRFPVGVDGSTKEPEAGDYMILTTEETRYIKDVLASRGLTLRRDGPGASREITTL